jgi:hypothetical protein
MGLIYARASRRNRFRRGNAALAAILAELAAVGVRPSAITQNKHLKLRWSHQGRTHTTVLPASPSDRRAARNATAFVRRQLDGRRP